MAIFTEKTYHRFLKKILVIHPFNAHAATGVGYDIRAGLIVHVDPSSKKITTTWPADDGSEGIRLAPNTYGVVISRERVFLSRHVAGTFHSKSSLAAQAVYLNSTSCDPNWKGRFVFCLYNASGRTVYLENDLTVATLVLHIAEDPSKHNPKDPREVLQTYLKFARGKDNVQESVEDEEGRQIMNYILQNNSQEGEEFDRQVDNAKLWSLLPIGMIRIIVSIIARFEMVRNKPKRSFLVIFCLAFILITTVWPSMFEVQTENTTLFWWLQFTAAIATLIIFIQWIASSVRKALGKDDENGSMGNQR